MKIPDCDERASRRSLRGKLSKPQHNLEEEGEVVTRLRPFLFLFLPFFVSLEDDVAFPSIFVPLSFSLFMESRLYIFPFRMVFSYFVTTDWIFDIIAYYVRVQIKSNHGDERDIF